MPQLIVYTLTNCPNCELLKEYLSAQGIPYGEQDMSSAASLTELRINGIFVSEAPVLRMETQFRTSKDLFARGSLREDEVKKLIGGN